MEPTSTTTLEPVDPADAETAPEPDDLVLADLLVDEISIDGMCGVY